MRGRVCQPSKRQLPNRTSAIRTMSLYDESFELKELQRLEGHTDRVGGLSWNPTIGVDGVPVVLASCSGDKTGRIWQQSSPSGSFECKVVLEETPTVPSPSANRANNMLACLNAVDPR
ncbi:unnamed protein product [Camellia sinensis]